MPVLSRSQTPIVHTDSGPVRGLFVDAASGVGGILLCCSFLVGFLRSVDAGESSFGRRLAIRFAITISVNILSPTTISSSSRTGAGRDEKYVRREEMHEYDGLNAL